MSARFSLASLLLGGAFALLLFLGGFFSYSSSPSFCRSCHNMEAYYDSWMASRHNSVTCTKCHFKPGLAGTLQGKFEASSLVVKYITGTYSPKPFAHIEDESCLQEGCHIKENLGKTKPFKGKAAFDHQPHFKEGLQSNLTCTACHSPLKKGKHISVNETHCYLCHLQEFDSTKQTAENSDSECVVCHSSLPKLIPLGKRNIEHEKIVGRKTNCYECHSHVVSGRGTVKESTCYNCHNFEERIAVRGERVKLHEIHIAKHLECFLCHDDIKHRIDPKAKEAGSDCRSCHLSKHSGIKTLYSGRGGIGSPERPGPMYQAGVDCIGCHDDPIPTSEPSFTGQTKVAVKQRCIECHANDERYGDILETWKKNLDHRLKDVEELLARAESKFGKKPAEPKIFTLLQNARYNFHFVSESIGVHNVGYSLNLLQVAEKNLKIALGVEDGIGEHQPPEEEDVFWFTDTEGLDPVRFDHSLHQTMFSDCEDCHSKFFDMDFGSADEMGMLTMSNMLRGRYCGACHNGEDADGVTEDCEKCHIKPEPVAKK